MPSTNFIFVNNSSLRNQLLEISKILVERMKVKRFGIKNKHIHQHKKKSIIIKIKHTHICTHTYIHKINFGKLDTIKILWFIKLLKLREPLGFFVHPISSIN